MANMRLLYIRLLYSFYEGYTAGIQDHGENFPAAAADSETCMIQMLAFRHTGGIQALRGQHRAIVKHCVIRLMILRDIP